MSIAASVESRARFLNMPVLRPTSITHSSQPGAGNGELTLPSGILVVDDHDLVRLGLRTLILSHAALTGQAVQVWEARTLEEALDLYRNSQQKIGLVLLDLQLSDAHGLTGLSTFMHQFPSARVVILSGLNDSALMRQAIAQGASAFLTKAGNLEHVVSYIRSQGLLGPSQGGSPVMLGADPVSKTETMHTSRYCNASGKAVQLTTRQVEVLEWILAGKANRHIAQMTGLSEGTIKNHASTLLLLFGVRSRAQLISLLR
jgi:DNA-binding NarL/FixJ family response regulator